MADRKYEPDKVYLQGPDGRIWPYEALLANEPGFVSVVPNKSKQAAKEDSQPPTPEDSQPPTPETEPSQASENKGTTTGSAQQNQKQQNDKQQERQVPPQSGNNAR